MTREEAIKKLRQMTLPEETRELLEALAPELKESEDERIRKELWEYFHSLQFGSDCEFSPKFTIDDILAYLEKQKPVEWSEEDEETRNSIILAIHDLWPYEQRDKCLSWLHSLPERFNLQPKQKWSEEDEEHLDSIIESYKELLKDYSANHGVDYIPYNTPVVARTVLNDIKFLKSLRPQPKEEREPLEIKYGGKVYQVYAVRSLPGGATGYIIEDEPGHYDCIINPEEVLGGGYGVKQNGSPYPTKEATFDSAHWKPSEEQMQWLESAVKLSIDKPHIHGTIISLYEQLKRL